MSDLNLIVELIKENITDLKNDMKEEFRLINSKLDNTVKKDDCTNNRDNCHKKDEWTVKKISVVTSLIVAIGTLILGIAKIMGFGG